MHEWTDDQVLSGRKAFDLWRFTEAPRAIPWDWADMADREKHGWIELACDPGRAMRPSVRPAVMPGPVRRAS